VKALLDAVLVDIGGTLVESAPAATAVESLEVTLRASVTEDLGWMAETVRVAAVTNTAVMDEAQVRSLLDPSGVSDLLEAVVTSVDVGVAKPDPKPLLVAMERLGLTDPSRVLFIGDEATDREAADAAGMHYMDVGDTERPTATLRAAVQGWLERNAGRRFEAARARIGPKDCDAINAALALQGQLTKPPGSLGRIEAIGVQLAGIAGMCPPPVPEPATVAVFAGDHGIVDWGVSPWPQEVTAQMVANFTAGGAAINVLAGHAGADIVVVDVGVATPLPVTDHPALIHRRIRPGTENLALGPAMSRIDALLALDVGVEIAEAAVAAGARCLIAGEMGIGNTTSAAAIIAGITNHEPEMLTGRGSGADDEMLARKVAVIEAATVDLSSTSGPLKVLEQVGGFEIAAIAGFAVGAAAARVPIVIDGVIANAALLIAAQLAPDVVQYAIAGHRSSEPAALAALEYLGLEPVLSLDLRLGEGTGAALALPIVQASAKILREMATFDGAGVSAKKD
jgi:nicotinate-nucleotide--dimethylbenzimidazole phosphoribosyltransferase